MVDGMPKRVPADGTVTLTPGESVCLPAGMYHTFWAEKARVMVGEVSIVSDDKTDNRFHRTLLRFPEIVEDVEPYRLLTCDYAKWLQAAGK